MTETENKEAIAQATKPSDEDGNIVQTTKPSDEDDHKKWSFLGWGLLFFFIWTILLMFILEAAIQPRDSLVATVIAYGLGILGLGIYGGLVRRKLKVILTVPLLIIIAFGTGFLLNFVFNAPIYNPFAPISERAGILLDAVETGLELMGDESLPVDFSIEEARFFAQFAFVIDLIIALPLFIFGTLSITMIVQIFSEKPKVLTIFTAFFALVFLVIGLVITPLLHISLASMVNLGGNTSMGVIYMTAGMQSLQGFENATQEDINQAVENFNMAAKYFRRGEEDLLAMLWVLGMVPDIGIAAAELMLFVQASLFLLDGIGPFVNGSYQMHDGFDKIATSLNLDESSSLEVQGSIKQQQFINDSLFDEGINQVQEGLDIYANDSLPNLRNAAQEIQDINYNNIYTALESTGQVGDDVDFESTMEEMQEYIDLFTESIDVINVLITRPEINGTKTKFSTLVHFIYGVKDLMTASQIIGINSNFTGTSSHFTEAYSNFSLVYTDLGVPVVQDAIEGDVPFLNDTLNFIYDMTGLSATVSSFGIDVGSVFDQLDVILDVFDDGFQNITDYPGLKGQLADFVSDTEALNDTVYNVEANVTFIQNKANEEGYGMFNEPAEEFTNVFAEFNLTTNVKNTNLLANAFYHLFSSMEYLKETQIHMKAGEEHFNDDEFAEAKEEFEEAIISINGSMDEMDQATYYMDQTDEGGMDQLESTRDSLISINDKLQQVVVNLDHLNDLAEQGGSADPNDVTGNITQVQEYFEQINDDLDELSAQ